MTDGAEKTITVEKPGERVSRPKPTINHALVESMAGSEINWSETGWEYQEWLHGRMLESLIALVNCTGDAGAWRRHKQILHERWYPVPESEADFEAQLQEAIDILLNKETT